jgi:hypothetical protein
MRAGFLHHDIFNNLNALLAHAVTSTKIQNPKSTNLEGCEKELQAEK